MQKSNEREGLKVLRTLVKQYEEPGLSALAFERLVTLVQAMQVADAQGNALSNADDATAERVAALAESMRPHLEVVLGPTIGALKRKAVAEIEAEIETHRNRIQIINDAGADSQSVKAAYNALIADGWKTHLTLDQWIEDDHERNIARMAEEHPIGRLEYELEQIQALFQRFVSQAGTLSKK